MPKREGTELNQHNEEEALQVADVTTDGAFPRASQEVLSQRRIVRAVRRTAAAAAPAAAVAVVAAEKQANDDEPTAARNPFANLIIPKKPTAEAEKKANDESTTRNNNNPFANLIIPQKKPTTAEAETAAAEGKEETEKFIS